MDEALATRTSLRSTAITAGALPEHDSIFDRDSADDLTPTHAEWCVDLGHELKAMNKFELWLALGTGDVAADARVWKVGRECWQPAHEIPDLACALKLHANVLIATVNAARQVSDDDRPTVVPGEVPAPTEAKVVEHDDVGNDAAKSDLVTSDARSDLATSDAVANDAPSTPNEPTTNEEVREMKSHVSETPAEGEIFGPSANEAEARSITPGPAIVEAPESLAPAAIVARRRISPRGRAASPLASAAALALLIGTSAFAASRVAGSDAPSAAAHLPSIAIATAEPPATPITTAIATPPRAAAERAKVEAEIALETGVSEAREADTESPSSEAEQVSRAPAPKVVEHHKSHSSKHGVRPTSVSPSHRGQGRQRQHSR